jgi:predicted O-methyltransferase YrrM
METKTLVNTKYHSFQEYADAEHTSGLKGKVATQLMLMYRKAVKKSSPVILELGTAKGESTTVFLQACEERLGKLVSVDIKDCSDISDSSRWQFVQSDSTNVRFILSQVPYLRDGIDILFIDSVHTRDHVKKELTGWYPYMNEQSWIFFDDVDANPYRKGNRKDKFRLEVASDAIHEYVQSFFYANEDNLHLHIIYGSTGLACLHKLSPRGTTPSQAILGSHHRKSKLRHYMQSFLSSVKFKTAR